jgi:hypothetical protein
MTANFPWLVKSLPETSSYDPDSEPRGSQYLNPNCLLLTYFNGDTSTVVDEHFSRALSQPSSFSSDRNGVQNSQVSTVSHISEKKDIENS